MKKFNKTVLTKISVWIAGILLVVCVGLLLTSCSDNTYSDENYESPLISKSAFRTDPETGVEYIVETKTNGVGICPRYNADGTLYINKGDDENE